MISIIKIDNREDKKNHQINNTNQNRCRQFRSKPLSKQHTNGKIDRRRKTKVTLNPFLIYLSGVKLYIFSWISVTVVLISGFCTCNSGFAGSDCSIDLSSPPSITYIQGESYCDVRDKKCPTDIVLVGSGFADVPDLLCHYTAKTTGNAILLLYCTRYNRKLKP